MSQSKCAKLKSLIAGPKLAVLPGVSRSGTTIATGLVLGLKPAAAARLSFLLSVPAILGASVVTAFGEDDGGAMPPRRACCSGRSRSPASSAGVRCGP